MRGRIILIADFDSIKKDKLWQSFGTIDPFNNNFVEGYISHKPNDMYGALFITKVNGDKYHQLIFSTPKIKYPFDKNGNWHFPKAKIIFCYTKLDGTNIFSFKYYGAKGKTYVSHKLRLQPFVRNAKFGTFLDMWKDILKNHPIIANLPDRIHMNLSYELWGSQNKHLIQYDTPLQTSLLYGRREGKILPPDTIRGYPSSIPEIDSLLTPLVRVVTRDYIWSYQEAQKEMERELTPINDGYKGREGEVWYVQTESSDWVLYKVKPETIETIHWTSGGMSRNIILATCQNAFEGKDDPSTEDVINLLLEEFSPNQIENTKHLIERCLEETYTKHQFVRKVLEEYNNTGLDFLDDSGKVMRVLSGKFTKDEIQKVYFILKENLIK